MRELLQFRNTVPKHARRHYDGPYTFESVTVRFMGGNTLRDLIFICIFLAKIW